MNDYLLEEASNMFTTEERWLAACKLSELIPEIKKRWFQEFMESLSEDIEKRLSNDERFDGFQIISDTEAFDDRLWYFFPKDVVIKEDDDGPLGLCASIQFYLDEKNVDFGVDFGLWYHYGKKNPSSKKLDKFFNEKMKEVISYFKEGKKSDWDSDNLSSNEWLIWKKLYPEGMNANLSDSKTIYYLCDEEKRKVFSAAIYDEILSFLSRHKTALIDAHNILINRSFDEE